jgi:glucose/arabinose dehydrogenase
MTKFRAAVLALVSATALASCGGESGTVQTPAPAPTPTPPPEPPKPVVGVTKTPVATFDAPWSVTVLPTNDMLVTERPIWKDAAGIGITNPTAPGALWLVTPQGVKTAVTGLPERNTGLFCVTLDPQYASNRQVFISYMERNPTAPRTGRGASNPAIDPSGVAIYRATLTIDASGPRLTNGVTIWRQTNIVSLPGTGDPGGYMAFSPDGRYLFIATGDRQEFAPVQDLRNTLGKVVRIFPDGTVPADNPFVNTPGAQPDIWTLGHRNPYGLSFDTEGRLWEHEMGPKGGDELNIIEPGKNYGWPNVSYGDDYDGTPIAKPAAGDGYAPAQLFWTPVIAPAGMVIYSGGEFAAWKGDALIGGLQSKGLVRVRLAGTTAVEAQRIDFGARIRGLAQTPAGGLYVLEDGPGGRLLKVSPVF